jgi:hypothetical protein
MAHRSNSRNLIAHDRNSIPFNQFKPKNESHGCRNFRIKREGSKEVVNGSHGVDIKDATLMNLPVFVGSQYIYWNVMPNDEPRTGSHSWEVIKIF